jgi:uncharacterized DUF497 family protein
MYSVHILAAWPSSSTQRRTLSTFESTECRFPRATEFLTIEDPTASGEKRFVTVGTNIFGSVMVVVWTGRGEDVRLISVRKAEPKERRNYEEGV